MLVQKTMFFRLNKISLLVHILWDFIIILETSTKELILLGYLIIYYLDTISRVVTLYYSTRGIYHRV